MLLGLCFITIYKLNKHVLQQILLYVTFKEFVLKTFSWIMQNTGGTRLRETLARNTLT